MENEEHSVPETYILSSDRAEEQALAEKRFRDEAVLLRSNAKTETNEYQQMEFRLQAEFLDAQAKEASNQIAYLQALSPTEEGVIAKMPSIEKALATINQKFDQPVDEATMKAYEEQGIPRYVIEMGNIRPIEDMPKVRKNRLDLYRLWRVEGKLDNVLAEDKQRLEDLEERQRLGHYDQNFKTDLALRDGIANTRWNIELVNEVLAEEPYPDEVNRGGKTRIVRELMADAMGVDLRLIRKSFDWREDGARRAKVKELQESWGKIVREYFDARFKTDWPDEFIQRATKVKTEIENLLEE